MKIIGVKIEDRCGDDSDFVEFKLSEVNYISVYRPGKNKELIPLYHTTTGAYAPLLTLKDISIAYKDYGFHYFDKSTIVNKSRIMHSKQSNGVILITFIDNQEVIVSGRSKYR